MENLIVKPESYPQKPFDEIALALSGGGFRAAAYGLGTMMYLNKLQFDSKSLLERVKFMSSASGGTIAVVFYLLSLHRKEDFEVFKNRLLRFMDGEKLLSDAQEMLSNNLLWENQLKSQNLINSFSKVYDKELMQMRWKSVWELSKTTHLKEVCINSTEFQSGLTFRFQNIEQKTKNIIGNRLVSITPNDVVKNIKMGDILAASSCFPIGFEPIIFPKDFSDNDKECLALENSISFIEANNQKIKGSSFGLMDGGITDNQAVESLMHAFDRRAKQKHFDLMIVADVSNRIIPPYKAPTFQFDNPNSISYYINLINTIIHTIVWVSLIGTIVSAVLLFFPAFKTIGLLFIIPSLLLLFGGLYLWKLTKRVTEWFSQKVDTIEGIPNATLKKYLTYFSDLKISTLSSLIIARLASVSTMTGEIFLKRIRRLIFKKFYEEKKYNLRRLSNLIYSLSKGYQNSIEHHVEQDITKKPERYDPNEAMMDIAETARTFGTTLWFSQENQNDEVLKKLLATAQFTLCNSLLNYFVELEKQKTEFNLLKDKKELLELKKVLLEDWEKFREDPYWMAS